MTDLEKLERKLSRIENKIDNLKEELDNMPEHWINKRAEKEDEISDLRSDKRALKREIKALEEELSAKLEAKKKSNHSKQSDEGCNKSNEDSKKSYSEHRNISNYSSRMEGDWSIRVYENGYSSAKNGKFFLKAESEDELLEKIQEFEIKQNERNLHRCIEKEYEENGWSIRIYGDGHATAKKDTELKRADSESDILEMIKENEPEIVDDEEGVELSLRPQYGYTSSGARYSKIPEQRRANNDYCCAACGGLISKGSQYICVVYHSVRYKSLPKKLYGGRSYSRAIHSNGSSEYHIRCYAEKENQEN